MRRLTNPYVRTSLLAAVALTACATGPQPATFSDCPQCPELVVIPAGSFTMGTPPEHRRIDPVSGRVNANEEPSRRVAITQPFALGKYEVTVGEFAVFVDATGFDAAQGCLRLDDGPGRLRMDPDLDWRNPGYAQTDEYPVVCVSFDHALAYVNWLTGITGYEYFIPSEAQWEYAAKAGTEGKHFWGDDERLACRYANVYFQAEQRGRDPADYKPPCDDGYDGIAPVGRFLPNAFGLHDTVANVWEWTPDCAHKNYDGAPVDGSAWIDDENCLLRMIRSGGVRNDLARTTHMVRAGRPRSGTAPNLGFRVARVLGDQATPVALTSAMQAGAVIDAWPADSEGGELFQEHCALCHLNKSSIKGIYGTGRAAIRQLIAEGGNNVMSMPAFSHRISSDEIDRITDYLIRQKGWE